VLEVKGNVFEVWEPLRIALILGSVPLLQKLPKNAQEALQSKLKFASFQPGEFVFRKGQEGDRFYMIIHGEVGRQKFIRK
jgi:CRP-like cAMP-binding protein